MAQVPVFDNPDYKWLPQNKKDEMYKRENTGPGSKQLNEQGKKYVEGLPTTNPLTSYQPVENKPYDANKDAGSILGYDLENAYKNMAFGNSNSGGGGTFKGGHEDISLADRSPEFMDFQSETTKYMTDLMKNAGDMGNSMFGQGAYNQISGDNDIVVQSQIKKLEQEFAAKGMDATHPAFIKAKNDMINAGRMFNVRALTDLTQKAGQYQIAVGDLVKNYYDVFSNAEEEQQKLSLATDQFNSEMKFKYAQARASSAASAASRQFSQQLSALNALQAFRSNEAGMATHWADKEFEARVADNITKLNYNMEMYRIRNSQEMAEAQQKNDILGSLVKGFFGIVTALV